MNNGININAILGRDSSYSLPSITDLTNSIQRLGRGSSIWKADLSRAYRQLRVDPLDCPLLGMKVNENFYVDLCPSFGCRSSSAACQRTSNALAYIMAQKSCILLAYLDDYASSEATYNHALANYHLFIDTADSLGLKLAKDKCRSPTTSIEWLGYQINTDNMTLLIPPKKLEEVLLECNKWINRSRANKRSLQSLIGKLIHVANCITHAKKFTSQLLATLRTLQLWTTLTPEAKLDITWFLKYAVIGNGVSHLSTNPNKFEIQCDACLDRGARVPSPLSTNGNSRRLIRRNILPYTNWKRSTCLWRLRP